HLLDLHSFPTRRSSDLLIDERWGRGLSDELRWLGDRLGAVRDPDVQLGHLSGTAADLRPGIDPYLQRLRDRQIAGRDALLEALRDRKSTRLNSSHVAIS